MQNSNRQTKYVIAVDGPAGAGKSTVARSVASRLGYVYVDTGAMYRALTLLAINHNVPPDDADGLAALLDQADIRLTPHGEGTPNQVFLNGQDVTDAIRQPHVNQQVSQIAAHAALRQRMVQMQQRLAENGGVVMDGRDIGTVVLPNADIKIFLVADINVRARRRWEELREKGHEVSIETVKAELRERDLRDKTRKESPLRKASDAIEIDTSDMTIECVVREILKLCK